MRLNLCFPWRFSPTSCGPSPYKFRKRLYVVASKKCLICNGYKIIVRLFLLFLDQSFVWIYFLLKVSVSHLTTIFMLQHLANQCLWSPGLRRYGRWCSWNPLSGCYLHSTSTCHHAPLRPRYLQGYHQSGPQTTFTLQL